jgi:hypothetical protein
MKLRSRFPALTLLLFVLALVALSLARLQWGAADRDDDSGGLVLERPSFVALAATDGQGQQAVDFLQQEAGISAYIKVDQTIDIQKLRASFRVVEQLEDTYLTGQIAIPNLQENLHPHLFVTRDGWIVAYYPRTEPTSKMLALWVSGTDTTPTLSGSTLELAIHEVLHSAGISPSPLPTIKYYHFQQPAADRLMLIRDDAEREDYFQITIPSSLALFDATWAAYDTASRCYDCWGGMKIDGAEIIGGNRGGSGWGIRFGDLLPWLKRDVQQTVSIWDGHYAVVLLYKAP